MSSKIPLKYHAMEPGIGGFHLYRDCFDKDNTYVYLEVSGVPFESTNVESLLSGKGLSSVSIRLPDKWARELGLIESGDGRKAKTRQRN